MTKSARNKSKPLAPKASGVRQTIDSPQQPALPRSRYRFIALVTKEIRLPFVRYIPGRNHPHYWQPEETQDYEEACFLGRQYAAHLAQLLKNNQLHIGRGLLHRIARDIDYSDRSHRRGLQLGFFNYLEVLLGLAGRRLNLYRHVEAVHELHRSLGVLAWLERKRKR